MAFLNRRITSLCILLAALCTASFDGPLFTPTIANGTLYYNVLRGTAVFSGPGTGSTVEYLDLRDKVYLIDRQSNWTLVRTEKGNEGYVSSHALSNVWIRVSKRKKTLFFYRGAEMVRKMPADFGNNLFSDKQRRGTRQSPDDWRTPEGQFYVVNKNPNSKYYKAFVLNYPSAEDARRGIRQGLISEQEYEAILQADATHSIPPMNTQLGGWIEIHGDGTGGGTNWTQGCVAIRNEEIDQLWPMVHVGTPVLSEY